MCGIFAILNENNLFQQHFIEEQFNKGKNRGPEFSKLTNGGIKSKIGFHRLAINGLNDKSNQPITIENVTLICNGEIYNYKELYDLMQIAGETDSDCEVIIHLYTKYGIEQTLQMLDGVFSFILCDNRISNSIENTITNSNKVYVARDPYGVRPLYILQNKNRNRNHDGDYDQGHSKNDIYGFASELKCLSEFQTLDPSNSNTYTIEHFEPGTYSFYELPGFALANWIPVFENKTYHSTGFNTTFVSKNSICEQAPEYIINNIQSYLVKAVEKRCLTTERPIACLLSGGLDSSLITALVNDYRKKNLPDAPPLETYSIGLAGSEDLKHAKIVANYLGTNHTEIVLTEQNFIDAIPEVVRIIESYDTTSVRASIGNYLLGKYISLHSKAKVIFNGDGADELCGGYLYMHKCPDAIEFDRETRRLLKDIHKFDVLRSDKCISSHGLEPRTPFLDRSWVQYYLSIDPGVRYHPGNSQCEKYLLRAAFSLTNFRNNDGNPILPQTILWRRKEAFSDGVSKSARSLYQIIQEFIEHESDVFDEIKITTNGPIAVTNEQKFYKCVFEKYYPSASNIVPYYWMPKYVNATDASARTLDLYNESSAT